LTTGIPKKLLQLPTSDGSRRLTEERFIKALDDEKALFGRPNRSKYETPGNIRCRW